MNVKIYGELKTEEIKSIDLILAYCRLENVNCYLIGGVVRDILLKKIYKDIDICIEIDPIKVIKYLLENYSHEIEKYWYYKEFMTSTIQFYNGIKIDLIRCRGEVYLQDGNLPVVFPSSLYKDILRRDFTINAIAYDLVNRRLLDFSGGLYDLARRIVKKIHENSYEEDPTRIFRAIKYAMRYNMKLGDIDEIKYLIKKDIVYKLSNDRIIKEMILLLKENEWRKIVYKLNEIGVLLIDYNLFERKSILFEEKSIEDKLIVLYGALKECRIKQIFLNNSIISKKAKKSFYIFKNKELHNKILMAYDNYEIFYHFNRLNSYEILALSFNSMIKYKLLNYSLNVSDDNIKSNGKMLKARGIKKGKEIGEILDRIMRINSNTLLNLDELVINDFVEENINGG